MSFDKIAAWLHDLLNPAWSWLLDAWAILRLARVAIAVSALECVLFRYLSQSEDVLVRLEENGFAAQIRFFPALVFLSMVAWYWTRTAVSFKSDPEARKRHPRTTAFLIANAPRIVGLLPVIILVIAVHGQPIMMRRALIVLAGLALFFWFRRPLSGLLFRLFGQPPGFAWLAMPSAAEDQGGSRLGTGLLVLTALFSLVQFAWAYGDPVGFAWFLRSPWTVALLALGGIVPILTLVLLLGTKGRVPLFSVMAGAMLLFSVWNDNHEVRTLREPAPKRPDLATAFKTWERKLPEGDSRTMYLVATAGGASRAAYWTAALLGGIQDSHPDFANHLFAISGVSGGSLGAVYFRALLEEGSGKPLMPQAMDLLARDYLGPDLAGLLYTDLVQLALPFPLPRDRAGALETSWERSWGEVVHSPRLARTFGTPDREDDPWRPILLLNGTDVGSGGRWVTSTVRWPEGGEDHGSLRDWLGRSGTAIRASTAAHNSARFPLISPPGWADMGLRTRIVDGGYYENSGAATLIDLIARLDDLCATDSCKPFELVVIQIDNDPEGDKPFETETGSFLGDLVNPATALYSTRSARAREETARLRRLVDERHGRYVPLYLRDLNHPEHLDPLFKPEDFPLNWVMSGAVLCHMHDQAMLRLEDYGGEISRGLAPPSIALSKAKCRDPKAS